MAIVAISRQVGSLGTEIAERVAIALGVPLIHDQIAKAVAARWNIDLDLIRGLRCAMLPRLNPRGSLAAAMVGFVRLSLLEFVAQPPGAVFRGWGAAQFLPAAPNIVRIFVGAPFPVRRKRVSARHNCDSRTASDLIRQSDEMKARLARDHAGVDWTSFDRYDLSLNTQDVSVEDAASQIVAFAEARNHAGDAALTERMIEQTRLEALARATLLHNRATRSCPLQITATAKGLVVVGIVDTGEQREAIVSSLSAVIGSVPILAQIRARTDYRTRTSSI